MITPQTLDNPAYHFAMNSQASTAQQECLTIYTVGRVDHIEWDLLIRIEAFSNYSKLFLSNGKTLFVAKVLKQFEAMLNQDQFIRPHKTHIVNRIFVKSYNKGDHPFLVLANGEKIPVSRAKKKEIKSIF